MASLTDGTPAGTITETPPASPVVPPATPPPSKPPVPPPQPPAPTKTEVTLGNGSKAYVDLTGRFTDASGKELTQEEVQAAKAPIAPAPKEPLATSSNPGGAYANDAGVIMNADGTPATAPEGAIKSTSNGLYYLNGKAYSVAPGTPAKSTLDVKDADAVNQQILKDKADQVEAARAFVQKQDDILNGVIPLTPDQQAQIAGLKQQYQALISQQEQTNKGAFGAANMRGFQKGSAEYDPTFQLKTISSVVAAGASKVSDLQTKMASAVAQLTSAFKTENVKAVKDAYDTLKTAQDEYDKGLQDYVTNTGKAVKEAQDALIAQEKAHYEQVQKPIDELAQTAANAGASASVLKAIRDSKSLGDAYDAAGAFAAGGTGIIGEYNYAKANGYTGSFTQYQNEDANRKAAASAAGLDLFSSSSGNADTSALGTSGTSGDILSATGLSLPAFSYLTLGTAALTRMDAPTRLQIMKQAQEWAKNNGIDVSTFQSQYKAYNDVLSKNIARANQTQIMAGEVAGSTDALIDVLKGDQDVSDPIASVHGNHGMTSLRAQNVLDLMIGKETNNPFATKYSFQIQTMANDLAGYFAASRGAPSPDDSDKLDAANVIVNGMNAKSAQAFKESIQANEEKVNKVVNDAVKRTRQQVWGLFGVGDKYTDPKAQLSPEQVTQRDQKAVGVLASYSKQSADNAAKLQKLHEIMPQASATEIAETLGIQSW